MSRHFIRYYVIKDSLRYINSNITYLQDTSNQALFRYALFYDANAYYKILFTLKNDPYQISTKIKENFPEFLKECMHTAYMHAEPTEQLFCYYLMISYVVDQFIPAYVDAFTDTKYKKDAIEKMLETYFFNKNEKLKLCKTNIADYFFDSFSLSEKDLELLERPIKRQFGFFCTKNYYQECYQSARFYFDHLATGNTGIKRPFYFFYDLLFNHRKQKLKARSYPYPKRLDTTLLNLTKRTYPLKDKEVNFSIDELYQEILKESRRACDVVNAYFTGNQNLKPYQKYFHKIETAGEN